ncbi:MAG: amino acid ABC transporter permease [Clostridia bacterium]|nr:amino acid ABC transporter permease [Clostridia bacterium]
MFWKVTLSLLEGFGKTLELFGVTLLFALPLGLIFSFASMSKFKPLKWLMKIFIWIIRGTPLMLQLIIIYYGPGLLGAWATKVLAANPTMTLFVPNFFLDGIEQICLGVMTWLSGWSVWDRFFAVSVAFVINYACYFSEIYRGGIESISNGQYEAGQVLGMTKIQVFFRVVLLQVVKRIIPPMSNEIITLVKDTSLARMISVYEIIWAGQAFIKSDGLLWPLFYTGAFYLIFNGILTVLFGKLEKKLDYFRG